MKNAYFFIRTNIVFGMLLFIPKKVFSAQPLLKRPDIFTHVDNNTLAQIHRWFLHNHPLENKLV